MTLPDLDTLLERFLPVTLANLRREYPHGHMLRLRWPSDLAGPRALHPAFFGCYDWHSAVHCHWQLARALRLRPTHRLTGDIVAALDASLHPDIMAGEMAYLTEFPGFEVPYGMAWVLALGAELRMLDHPAAPGWRAAFAPLEAHASAALERYAARLPMPIRSGLHHQTAFSLGLALDWCQVSGEDRLREALADRVRHFFAADLSAPLEYEPSATDFLSPALAEADVMRRALEPALFTPWLEAFLGSGDAVDLPERLPPARVADYADGQLGHFCGLNLSRSWMLRAVADALPEAHVLRPPLQAMAAAHLDAGWSDALHADYMVSHWAPSFLLYALTR